MHGLIKNIEHMLSRKFYLIKELLIELCQNIVGLGFSDTDRQIATVAMETTQLVLSQFKNFLTY